MIRYLRRWERHASFCACLLLLGLAGCAANNSRPAKTPEPAKEPAANTPAAFFPLGIFSVRDTNDLATVKHAGFNLVTGPVSQEYLDAARRAGLAVLCSPGTTAGPEFDPALARQAVARFDRHPALWGWYLVDEPDLNWISPDDVRQAHQYLKSLHARKPTALVLYQGASGLNYANIADLTMIDRYPVPWLPLASFGQNVRMMRLALGKDKPLLAVIQAFDWSYYPENLPGEKDLRPPNCEELHDLQHVGRAHHRPVLFFVQRRPLAPARAHRRLVGPPAGRAGSQ
jgi:hypothetical protein